MKLLQRDGSIAEDVPVYDEIIESKSIVEKKDVAPKRIELGQRVLNSPTSQELHFKEVRSLKRVGMFIGGLLVVLVLLLFINMVWSNLNASNGAYQNNATVFTTTNVDTPDVTAPVNIDDKDTNNYDQDIFNNITIILDDSLAESLADAVRDIIEEGTNSS